MKILLLLTVFAAACGFDQCPPYTHEIDAGVCETDCGFQPNDAGTAAVKDNMEPCKFEK